MNKIRILDAEPNIKQLDEDGYDFEIVR